jgi:hypothetical protein
MKSFLFLFSIFILCNFSWAQTAEEKEVNGVFISYIHDDGKACNKCNKALQKYPNNQKLLLFKKQHCNLSPPSTPLTVNLSKTNVSVSGGSDGTAKANVSGGKPPYQYSWSNGNNGSKVTNLAAGTYSITVTDNAGETTKASVTISAPNTPPPPPPPAMKLTLTHSNVSAAGKSDGTAKVSVSGGKAPYQYDWSNGDTGSKITNLSPGTYKVTVTDNSGKTKTGKVTIADKKPESIDVNLRETSQNIYSWNRKLKEIGATVTIKITSGNLYHEDDVSDKFSYIFKTINSKWDGIPCTVELIIKDANGVNLKGSKSIKTSCGCKPKD